VNFLLCGSFPQCFSNSKALLGKRYIADLYIQIRMSSYILIEKVILLILKWANYDQKYLVPFTKKFTSAHLIGPSCLIFD